jgi:phosphonate transport system ATP-binding protein
MNLQLQQIQVSYGKPSEPALSSVSLTFQPKEFVCVIGSSGAGKSTLIRCMNLLVRPTHGSVIWNGTELTRMSEKQLRGIRSQIGMIFQQFQLVPRLSVLTNVLLGSLGKRSLWKNVLGYFSPEEKRAAQTALEQVGLGGYAAQRVEHLSGGQQQRVAIARLLLQKPQIVLGDEPVSSLDPVISRSIMELLSDIHQRHGLITVINLHDVELAKQFATRIIGISRGLVVFDGRPDELTDEAQQMIYQESL